MPTLHRPSKSWSAPSPSSSTSPSCTPRPHPSSPPTSTSLPPSSLSTTSKQKEPSTTTSKSKPKKTAPVLSALRALARMSLQAQAIVSEHAAVPVLSHSGDDDVPEDTSMAVVMATEETTSPRKWWTELIQCEPATNLQRHSPSSTDPTDPYTAPTPFTGDTEAKAVYPCAAYRALFSKMSYPTILDAIILHASQTLRRTLRLVCRRLAVRTDALTFATLIVREDGFHCPDGPLPLINLWRRPDVATAIRVLTIAECDFGVLADVFPGVSPDVLRVPAGLDDLGIVGRSVVAFADIVPLTTGDWLHIHSLPLTLPDDADVHRLIYTIRHADPDLLLVTLPDAWEIPAAVDLVVIHIGPHPSPNTAPQPEVFDRAHADDGAHTFLKNPRRSSDYGLSSSPGTSVRGVEWLHAAKGHPCFLDKLASVVANNLRPGRRFIFVGPENWDERWLCSSPSQSTIVYRFFYTVVRHARRVHRWNGRFAERALGAALGFTPEDEYRAQVGEERFRLETVMCAGCSRSGHSLPPS